MFSSFLWTDFPLLLLVQNDDENWPSKFVSNLFYCFKLSICLHMLDQFSCIHNFVIENLQFLHNPNWFESLSFKVWKLVYNFLTDICSKYFDGPLDQVQSGISKSSDMEIYKLWMYFKNTLVSISTLDNGRLSKYPCTLLGIVMREWGKILLLAWQMVDRR